MQVKICSNCGSQKVLADAYAEWDPHIEDWVINNVFEEYFCENCEKECDVINTEIEVNTQEKINSVTESLKHLLIEKNGRYGNSALEPLEGIKYTVEDGIKIRLSDKVKRIINSEELRKNDLADILGYLVLLCISKDFLNFDDLID